MVTAGFTATRPPRSGPRSLEDQLGLLWKMADEPVLLFDGDKAGRRAAYRAVDLALPRLAPGKSLLFASLPDGNDPDDLVRSGGRGAVADVLASRPVPSPRCCGPGRPRAGRFDTPERRAGLDAPHRRDHGDDRQRIGAQNTIARIWRRAPAPCSRHRAGKMGSGAAVPAASRIAGQVDARPGGTRREPMTSPSPRLAESAVVRGARAALPAREALDSHGLGQTIPGS